MLPLTKQELKQHANVCDICGKRILKKLSKSVNYRKLRDHCLYTGKYRGAAHSIWNLNLMCPMKTVFQNASNYGYHFIIRK